SGQKHRWRRRGWSGREQKQELFFAWWSSIKTKTDDRAYNAAPGPWDDSPGYPWSANNYFKA
ncbi:MAG: hypothetical protein WB821_00890, partial [Burkholderiaceae bacterium]